MTIGGDDTNDDDDDVKLLIDVKVSISKSLTSLGSTYFTHYNDLNRELHFREYLW